MVEWVKGNQRKEVGKEIKYIYMFRGVPDVPTTGSIDGKCRICKLRDNVCVGPSDSGSRADAERAQTAVGDRVTFFRGLCGRGANA